MPSLSENSYRCDASKTPKGRVPFTTYFFDGDRSPKFERHNPTRTRLQEPVPDGLRRGLHMPVCIESRSVLKEPVSGGRSWNRLPENCSEIAVALTAPSEQRTSFRNFVPWTLLGQRFQIDGQDRQDFDARMVRQPLSEDVTGNHTCCIAVNNKHRTSTRFGKFVGCGQVLVRHQITPRSTEILPRKTTNCLRY